MQNDLIYQLVKISTDALLLIEFYHKDKDYLHIVEKLNKILFLAQEKNVDQESVVYDLFEIAFDSVILAQDLIGTNYYQITTLVQELAQLVSVEENLKVSNKKKNFLFF